MHKDPEARRACVDRRNVRRIRMCAGGIQFYLGCAPTPQAAARIKAKIRTEAP